MTPTPNASIVARMIATVGGIGYLRPAPGTWGSLSALPITWALHQLGGFPAILIALVVITAVGYWAIAEVTRGSENHDPSEVVIDEVAGQMLALVPLSYSAWSMGIDVTALWPGWIAAFLLFRLFDITKLGPIGTADRRGDAWGVMLDDLIAGFVAAIGVLLLAGLAHVVIGV
jgi:phosphatidylglycerophosphatase A